MEGVAMTPAVCARTLSRVAGTFRDERGSILPLTVFFAALALAVVLLAAAATSLYLERERLYALADGASLAGADAWDPRGVEVTEAGPSIRLTTAAVRGAVDNYLESAAADGFEGLQVERAETGDAHSAVVSLSVVWRPPVVSFFVPEGLRIEVTSTARSVLS
jgi:uncharacterized membrane protein